MFGVQEENEESQALRLAQQWDAWRKEMAVINAHVDKWQARADVRNATAGCSESGGSLLDALSARAYTPNSLS
jgi:hypothetical protein